MPTRLTDQEVAARMVELRNLRKLHARDRKQLTQLKAENKELRAVVASQQAQLTTQAIQIAELQTMVFGKKKKPPTGTFVPVLPAPAKGAREASSYRRPLPPASATTQEVAVPLPDVCGCGGSFDRASLTMHDRYQEDIPLPGLTADYQQLMVTKYRIQQATCSSCGKRTSGKDLGGAQVALGPNVRLLVTHLVARVGMSYAQVADLLLTLYGLRVSDGELARILQRQQHSWSPAYQQLLADIRAAPIVHADETSWPIQALQGAGYAWVVASATTQKVCFSLQQSRGAVHAKTLFGQNTDQPFAGVRITDDYAAYRSESLPGQQQLCWAHLYRTIRDLRDNAKLPEAQLPSVKAWYVGFAGVYGVTCEQHSMSRTTTSCERLTLTLSGSG